MKTITLQDIRKHGSKSITGSDPIYLIVNSKPKCVMLPVELYEQLTDMIEDLDDLRVYKERQDEETISHEEIRALLDT